MTAVAHLNSLYAAAPIILWVEDTITREITSEKSGTVRSKLLS